MPDSACTYCKGTSWKPAPDGFSYTRCNCRQPIDHGSQEVDLDNLPERERKVYRLLERHQGSANAIKQADIAHAIGLSRREVGAVVQSLIINYGLKIGSGCGKR